MATALQPRPAWLRGHIPALDGLRGLAILLVVLFHCDDRLKAVHLYGFLKWGWTGVNLFFVLSGFLITGILLDERDQPHFFRNFYARRALRIWPVYFLLLPVNYWLCGGASNTWNHPSHAPLTYGGVPWLYFILFVQNLTPGLVGTIFPVWSLAIEEQFYVVWAPIARFCSPAALMCILGAVLAAEPAARRYLGGHFTGISTVYHVDGLAVGAFLAISLRRFSLSLTTWRTIAGVGLAIGVAGWFYALFQGGPYFDTWLAIGFGGMLLLTLLPVRGAHLYQAAFSWAPIRYLGTISYGLYLCHEPTFARLGWIDSLLDKHHPGVVADLTIVVLRLAVSILVASALWFGFERPILSLKRKFRASAPPTRELASIPSA